MTQRTPALWSFLGIYFNQDWPEDYGTEEASVSSFLADDPDGVASLLTEIDWVLSHHPAESELESYLDSQGNQYLPPEEGGGYRGWLTRIADRVRAASAA